MLSIFSVSCLFSLLCLCYIFKRNILFKCTKKSPLPLHVDNVNLRRVPSIVSTASEESLLNLQSIQKDKRV